MAIGDVFRLSVVGRFGLGQQFVNVFHYEQTDTVVGNPAEALAAEFSSQALPSYLSLIPSSNVVDTVEVRQVTGTPLNAFDNPINDPGGLSGEQLPPQVAPLISWRTALVGRRNRGRTYIPAPTEPQQVAGTLIATYVTAMETFIDDVQSLVNALTSTENFHLGIFHSDDSTITPTTEGIPRTELATQRRRRLGVGS